jgi:glucose/mannose-6-phosphate isomerase
MNTLDSLEEMKKLDPSNVLGSIGMFPDQCLTAWNEASKVEFPQNYKQAANIVVCGMGGSRFTPKTIRELFFKEITVPYEIVDGYDLPGYVNEQTLVILSSYSGSTEEVLSCAELALTKKAMLTGLAHGGSVIELLKTNNLPYYQFDAKYNPCGQPRVGGGYLLFGHLAFLSTLGFLAISQNDVTPAIEFARLFGTTINDGVPTEKNAAKQLAILLKDKHPFLIAGEFLRGAVNGFANQINETAKMISDFRYIPELNHHLLEGLMRPDTLHQNGLFVFLNSSLYCDKIKKRFAVTKDVVEKQHVATHGIELTGKTKLAQVIELFTLSGYTTFYLAMLYDTDPVSIPWVDYFKKQLAL